MLYTRWIIYVTTSNSPDTIFTNFPTTATKKKKKMAAKHDDNKMAMVLSHSGCAALNSWKTGSLVTRVCTLKQGQLSESSRPLSQRDGLGIERRKPKPTETMRQINVTFALGVLRSKLNSKGPQVLGPVARKTTNRRPLKVVPGFCNKFQLSSSVQRAFTGLEEARFCFVSLFQLD